MKLEGHQTRLTVRTRWPPIVQRAHRAGMAGASVFRSAEGDGASNHIHDTRILSLCDDLPIAVITVDTDERIAAFLAYLDELITEGPVIIDDFEVVKYVGRPARSER
jgi:PII-like signaling protein